jgi:Flp pilus assembly pilin Flp
MALVAAVWVAGYVVQKTVSLAISLAWSSVTSAKQGQEAYEERKR